MRWCSTGKHDVAARRFAQVGKDLAERHVAMQEAAATNSLDRAAEFSRRIQDMPEADLTQPDGLIAAVQYRNEKAELLRGMREAIGTTVGALDMAAALNEAFLSGGDKSVQTNLGALP